MGKLDEYTSKSPAITGSTTINHAARVALGLNCSEYVLLDYLARRQEKGEGTDTITVYIRTGLHKEAQGQIIGTLMTKGFLLFDSKQGVYEVTSKWMEAFADIEKEFDNRFWKKDGKVDWTGTRKKALEYYIKIRKRYSLDFLLKQRDNYCEFLKVQKKLKGFDQQKMMCQVFLNPANERYLEDYADYIKQLNEKYGIKEESKPKPITREEVLNQYGKNNNE